jgi:hypothetical protein
LFCDFSAALLSAASRSRMVCSYQYRDNPKRRSRCCIRAVIWHRMVSKLRGAGQSARSKTRPVGRPIDRFDHL